MKKNKGLLPHQRSNPASVPPIQPLPQDQPGELKVLHRNITEIHSGPLPRPEILQSYEKVMPGLAGKIVRMAEREQKHRHRKEVYPHRLVLSGQVFGFSLGLLGLIGGGLFAHFGLSGAAIAAILGGSGCLVGAAIWGRPIRFPETPENVETKIPQED